MRIAQAIEDVISSKGMSRKDFSDIIGVQPSVVTKWLSGYHNFTLITLCKIEATLETQIIHIIKH